MCERNIAKKPRVHHLANHSYSMCGMSSHLHGLLWLHQRITVSVPDTIMSSFLDGSYALTAQMNVSAALETKKAKLVLVTHIISVCFTVNCSSFNYNMWLFDSLTTGFTLFLALPGYHIIWQHIFDTNDIYQISLILQHFCSVLSRHPTSWCHILLFNTLVNII